MRIDKLIAGSSGFFSLEFFPPRNKDSWPAFFQQMEMLKRINPLFASVTYGAGGSTQDNTLEVVTRIKKEMELEPMAHLTCVGANADSIHDFLQRVSEAGIQNILALRGDPPEGDEHFVPDNDEFQHATDLVAFIRENFPEICIGVAGYPEVHPEAENMDEDLNYLRLKEELGADFVLTQLFFDNQAYFDYVQKARDAGLKIPIIPGVMPILSLKLIKKIISLCGASIPEELKRSLEKANAENGDEGVRNIGIEYAQNQVQELFAFGVPGVHLYTLNKADASMRIAGNVLHNLKDNPKGEEK
ncbi:MAG: methylenetetrahydrofolate reductase [NAD(P)H] [Thermodesulfobacteriota bacterium]